MDRTAIGMEGWIQDKVHLVVRTPGGTEGLIQDNQYNILDRASWSMEGWTQHYVHFTDREHLDVWKEAGWSMCS